MKLVVISPPSDEPREAAVLASLVASGLERYHVRKPDWSRAQLEAWLQPLDPPVRARLVLHQHHELVATYGLLGRHWRDAAAAPAVPPRDGGFTSRSCHDLKTLAAALGHYDAVFFGPLFPSISKPGHGATSTLPLAALTALLATRSPAERRTTVIALGGITPSRLARVGELGFDGAALLGALWEAPAPLDVWRACQTAAPVGHAA